MLPPLLSAGPFGRPRARTWTGLMHKSAGTDLEAAVKRDFHDIIVIMVQLIVIKKIKV
jgi:hypothetical protein